MNPYSSFNILRVSTRKKHTYPTIKNGFTYNIQGGPKVGIHYQYYTINCVPTFGTPCSFIQNFQGM